MIENFPDNVLTVGSTGDFATISGALAAVAGMSPAPSATSPYRLLLLPGSYDETVSMIPFVSLTGINAARTVICGSGYNVNVMGASNSSIENITITNTGLPGYGGMAFGAVGVSNLTLRNVTLQAAGGTSVLIKDCKTNILFDRSEIVASSPSTINCVMAFLAWGSDFEFRNSRILSRIQGSSGPLAYAVTMLTSTGRFYRSRVEAYSPNPPQNCFSFQAGASTLKVADTEVFGATEFFDCTVESVNLYSPAFQSVPPLQENPQSSRPGITVEEIETLAGRLLIGYEHSHT